MKKIKRLKEEKHSNLNVRILLIGLAVVLAVVIFLILLIENDRGKIVVKNNTGLNLEYVKITLVDTVGPFSDPIEIKSLNAGKSSAFKYGKFNFIGREGNLEIRFKFENNKELFVDSGLFYGNFSGKINIDFNKSSDDVVKLKVKAKNGFVKDVLNTCNDLFTINLKDGTVE